MTLAGLGDVESAEVNIYSQMEFRCVRYCLLSDSQSAACGEQIKPEGGPTFEWNTDRVGTHWIAHTRQHTNITVSKNIFADWV